jgi:hypothetical protein
MYAETIRRSVLGTSEHADFADEETPRSHPVALVFDVRESVATRRRAVAP